MFRSFASLLVIVGGAMQLLGGAPAYAQDKVRIFSGTDEHWVQLQVAKTRGFFSK